MTGHGCLHCATWHAVGLLLGADYCWLDAGTPALREALAPPSAGRSLLGFCRVGAVGAAQYFHALRGRGVTCAGR